MLTSFLDINWLAVLAGVIVFFLLGGLWFQFVVGKAYEAALGVAQKEGLLSLAGPLGCLCVITIANAWLMAALGLEGLQATAGFGLIVGLGYLLPMTLNIAINPLFPRPFYYTALNAPFFIGGSVLSCVVIRLI
ncbi:DUF1761 domain-containing protein [Rhodobacteraceae bacterium]|nr:DUF1761 domain-containing protein [Paracoccaceae bacterium]